MDTDKSPVAASEAYVKCFFRDHPTTVHRYHTTEHTLEIVAYCIEIGKGSGLSNDEMELIQIAAWFHDTGYDDAGFGHEAKSAKIARNFLESVNYPQDKIKIIEDCILVTNLSTLPDTFLEKVIRDADLAYLGTDDFLRQSNNLRVEWILTRDQAFPDLDWFQAQVNFLGSHIFYTSYAKNKFHEGKLQNLEAMKKVLEGLKNDVST